MTQHRVFGTPYQLLVAVGPSAAWALGTVSAFRETQSHEQGGSFAAR